jgi:hypothetical protein
MHLDPHVALAAIASLGAGWLTVVVGFRKSALEHRRERRVCPSCGRRIEARACSACSS